MADQKQKKLDIDNLEVTELEDEDLEGVSGGDPVNNGCTVNNCPIIKQPGGAGGDEM